MVTNERAIPLQLTGDALGDQDGTLLGAGDSTAPFSVGGPKKVQPVIVAATDPLGLGYQLTDVLLRLLPDSGVFTEAGDYGPVLQMIVQSDSKVWDAATILGDAKAGHLTLAAEEAVKLVTGLGYIEAFVTAANLAGQHFGIPVCLADDGRLLRRPTRPWTSPCSIRPSSPSTRSTCSPRMARCT